MQAMQLKASVQNATPSELICITLQDVHMYIVLLFSLLVLACDRYCTRIDLYTASLYERAD
jgi:hypothetical protein